MTVEFYEYVTNKATPGFWIYARKKIVGKALLLCFKCVIEDNHKRVFYGAEIVAIIERKENEILLRKHIFMVVQSAHCIEIPWHYCSPCSIGFKRDEESVSAVCVYSFPFKMKASFLLFYLYSII